MSLYNVLGYLNLYHIDIKKAWLNIILGARQVGKTYGTLELMLQENRNHILLRRTTAELDTIASNIDLSPYKVFEPRYYTGLFRSGKKLCQIADYITDDNGKPEIIKARGIATSLSEIAHIRGFSGGAFSDLVFDEFIPEKGVIIRKSEGDAFLNAYVTINGNRELQGKPPLRAWLLANTNNIDSPILEALNLTDSILYMQRKGLEELLLDNGVYIIQPKSEGILSQREQTALMRQVNRNSEFYGMAIKNEFAYDESPYVKLMPIKGMKPAWCYDDLMYCREYSGGYYISRAPFKVKASERYSGTKTGREQLELNYSFIIRYYYAGMVAFSDLRLLSLFKQIFNIK